MKKVQLVTEDQHRGRFSEEFKAMVLAEISEDGLMIASVASVGGHAKVLIADQIRL